MGVRYYKPEIGRWITRDRYQGEQKRPGLFNKYVYCLNSPVANIDPSGNVPLQTGEHKAKWQMHRYLFDNKLANLWINHLTYEITYKYKGGYITHESASGRATWRTLSGWRLQDAWRNKSAYKLPAKYNYGSTEAYFANYIFPLGPYYSYINVGARIYGDGKEPVPWFNSWKSYNGLFFYKKDGEKWTRYY